ncbi:MAG: hypothetical protein MUF16_11750 [Burkholderiaceae bacterium]|jgi:hypothetical protein|nr:hypothetical protein [Burkholderiaceae bacterium]
MSPAPIVADWRRVGCGLSVRFSFTGERLECEWSPRLPTVREFRRVLDRYRVARHELLDEVSRRIGGTVLCVEVVE